MLRANRKNNFTEVINAKLRTGDLIAGQNENKIVVLKWKENIDVLMLSTKHDTCRTTYQPSGKEVTKPSIIVDYNKGKSIDL